MKRLIVLLAVVAVLALSASAAMAEHGGSHAVNPCIGGCDAEYISFGMSYDPFQMWATYGYPIYQDNRYWYWIPEEGRWWYFLPHTYGGDGNLYPYEG